MNVIRRITSKNSDSDSGTRFFFPERIVFKPHKTRILEPSGFF